MGVAKNGGLLIIMGGIIIAGGWLGSSSSGSGSTSNNKTGNESGGKLNAKNIRFSQDSISARFKDGTSVDDLLQGLKSGKINPNDVPAIRIFEKEGVIYTLDNGRLYAFNKRESIIFHLNGQLKHRL